MYPNKDRFPNAFNVDFDFDSFAMKEFKNKGCSIRQVKFLTLHVKSYLGRFQVSEPFYIYLQ